MGYNMQVYFIDGKIRCHVIHITTFVTKISSEMRTINVLKMLT